MINEKEKEKSKLKTREEIMNNETIKQLKIMIYDFLRDDTLLSYGINEWQKKIVVDIDIEKIKDISKRNYLLNICKELMDDNNRFEGE
jgi:hypothetical protein